MRSSGFGPTAKTIPRQRLCSPGFTQGLSELGWIDGRNLRMDLRWGAGNVDRMRMFAKELVDLQPSVIVANGLRRPLPPAGSVDDPDRICDRLRRPGRLRLRCQLAPPEEYYRLHAHGSIISGKSLEMLREIAPSVRRGAFMFNPDPFVTSISWSHSKPLFDRSKSSRSQR
jgi:putative ABC transport system substrate-binding protein